MFLPATVAALVVALASAKPSLESLKGYTFESYLKDFNLSFPKSELESRRAIFQQELARVIEHNAKGVAWKETINKNSAYKKEELKARFGRAKSVANVQGKELKHAKELPADFVIKPLSELPESVDWREKDVVSAVKDQGHCGSCWAFASTATMESHIAINSGLLFALSMEQIAMCAPNTAHCGGTGGCEGSTAELAFEYATSSSGLYEEYQYGYSSYYGTDYACSLPSSEDTSPVAAIDGYVKLPNNNYTAVMNAIATVGPLAINVDASTWHAYDSGVYSGCNQETPDVNHVVVMVGYGEENGQKYWLVRNSWSPTWGEAGYIKLARADPQVEEVCGMDVTPTDGVECEGSEDTPVRVCGTCGAIYDVSYPLNARAL